MNDLKNRLKAYFFRNPMMKEGPVVTFVTLGICILVYLAQAFLAKTYGENNAAIALGAYYRNYIIVLNQYWRFITYGFTHGSITHLAMNMYALCSLGALLENILGHKRFALALYLSTLVAGLLIHVTGSEFVVGLSGGLFGLMGVLFMIDYRTHRLNDPNVRMAYMRIVTINVIISLMPSVSLVGHVGGLVAGILVGCIFTMPSNERKSVYFYNLLFATVLLIGSLSFLMYRDRKVVSYYSNDLAVLRIYEAYGINVDKQALKIRQAWEEEY